MRACLTCRIVEIAPGVRSFIAWWAFFGPVGIPASIGDCNIAALDTINIP